jgi:hypothetical protein
MFQGLKKLQGVSVHLPPVDEGLSGSRSTVGAG